MEVRRGAAIGVGIGSVAGEIVSGLFGSDEALAPLQQAIVETSHHAAEAFKRQGETAEALAAAQGQVRQAQHRSGEATDDLVRAERRLERLRENHGSTNTVLSAEAAVSAARHRQTRSIREESEAYEAARLAEGANKHAIVESVAAANLAIAADRRHVKQLNERWQGEAHTKELTEEVTRATGLLSTEEEHRNHLLQKAEHYSDGFARSVEGLTAAQSQYGRRGHVLTDALGEVHSVDSIGPRNT